MKKQLKPKYAFQRVEARRNNIDKRGLNEQAGMEHAAARITIGTFTLLSPKSHDSISNFTLAFTKPIPKHELYLALHDAFDGHWNGEPVRSIMVRLSVPMTLDELRSRIKSSIELCTLTHNDDTHSSVK